MKYIMISFMFVFVTCMISACSRNVRETRPKVAGDFHKESPHESASTDETRKKNEHEVQSTREKQTIAPRKWNVEQQPAARNASDKGSPPLLLNDDEWRILWDTRKTQTYSPARWQQSGQIVRVEREGNKIAILHGKQTAFICDANTAWQVVDVRANGKELDLRCRSFEENSSCGALYRWDGHKLTTVLSGWWAVVHDGDTRTMDPHEDEGDF